MGDKEMETNASMVLFLFNCIHVKERRFVFLSYESEQLSNYASK